MRGELRWVKVLLSSSKVRLSVEREDALGLGLMVIGPGERDNGEVLTVLFLEDFPGWRIGRAGDVAVGVLAGDPTADAETTVVCGSLGPLRKGLNNQEGANLEVKDGFVAGVSAFRPFSSFIDVTFVVPDEQFDRTDRIDDWDGDALSVVKVAVGVFSNTLGGREGPGTGNLSSGRSLVTLMGLSSIVGPIFVEMIEFR